MHGGVPLASRKFDPEIRIVAPLAYDRAAVAPPRHATPALGCQQFLGLFLFPQNTPGMRARRFAG